MEMNRNAMIIGVILTLICVVTGLVCLIVNPSVFTIIMFVAIVGLAVFQSVALWLIAKKQK